MLQTRRRPGRGFINGWWSNSRRIVKHHQTEFAVPAPLTGLQILNYACVIYLIVWIVAPPLAFGTQFRVLGIASALVWAITAAMIYPGWLVRPVRSVYVAVLLLVGCVLLVASLSTESWLSAIVRNLNLALICIMAVIFETYSRYDRRMFSVSLVVVLVLFCIFGVTTFQTVTDHVGAARIANRTEAALRFEDNPLVGTYGFVYGAVQLAPLLLFAMLGAPKRSHALRILIVVTLVICTAVVLKGGYTLAIVCLLIGFLVVVALQRVTLWRLLLMCLTAIVISTFGTFFYQSSMKLLRAGSGDNLVYVNKLDDINATLVSGQASGSVFLRTKRYESSLITLVRYPVIGQYIFDSARSGGHSDLIDVPGNYGWAIAALFYNLVFWTPLRIAGVKGYSALKLALVVTSLFHGLLNTYAAPQALIWFMAFPYVCWLTERQTALRPEGISRRVRRRARVPQPL